MSVRLFAPGETIIVGNARTGVRLAGGGGASLLPFADDFARADGAIGNGWTGSTWTVSGNKAINTPGLGSELIVNGTFASDTDWTKGTGWTIGSGVASHTAGSAANVSQAVLTSGLFYQAIYTLSAMTAVGFAALFGTNTVVGPTQSTDATFTHSKRAAGTSAGIRSSSLGAGSVDSISYKQLVLSSLMATRDRGHANCDISVDLTVLTGNEAGIVLCVDDAANPSSLVRAVHNGVNVVVEKCVAGTWTSLIDTAATYVASATLRVKRTGTTFQVFYNGSQIGSDQTISDVALIYNTRFGMWSTSVSNTLDNFTETGSPGVGVMGHDLHTGTSLQAYSASRVPHQRSGFYAAGLWWAVVGFYDSSGPHELMLFSSTNGGESWTAPIYLGTFPALDAEWSVVYEESAGKLHVATCLATGVISHEGLRYRRGTPNTDGSFTWDAAWQTVVSLGSAVGDFSLEVGSDGHVWVGYGTGYSADGGIDGPAKAIRNDNTDGTWSTTEGFPVTVDTPSTEDAFAILAPLDDGTMVAAVYEFNVDAQARGYHIAADGTVSSEGNITTASVEAQSGVQAKVARIEISSIHDGEIHLVYQDTSQNIKYRKRSMAGSWGSETTLSNNARVTDTISSPRIAFGATGQIYVLWSQSASIWLCTYNGSSWGAPVEVASDNYEASYEHAIPALMAHDGQLQVLTLLDDYTLRQYLFDVA